MNWIFLYLLSEMHVRVYHHSIIGAAVGFLLRQPGFCIAFSDREFLVIVEEFRHGCLRSFQFSIVMEYS